MILVLCSGTHKMNNFDKRGQSECICSAERRNCRMKSNRFYTFPCRKKGRSAPFILDSSINKAIYGTR